MKVKDLKYYIGELKKDKELILNHFESHIRKLEFKARKYRNVDVTEPGGVESYYDRLVRNKRVYNILKFLLK